MTSLSMGRKTQPTKHTIMERFASICEECQFSISIQAQIKQLNSKRVKNKYFN